MLIRSCSHRSGRPRPSAGPSFVLVALTAPWIPRLRRSVMAGGFLDGVDVASLGLMAAVSLQLAPGGALVGIVFAAP